jgi:hypothetical protein
MPTRGRTATVTVGAGILTAAVLIVVAVALRSEPRAAVPSGSFATADASGVMRFSDVVTRPVPAGVAAPKLSSGDALLVAHTLELDGFGSGEPRVSLRLATRQLGANEGFADRLTWVIEYPNSPMLIFGPPALSDEQRAQMEQSGLCEFVVVVDANTAVALTSVQVCQAKQ